MSSLLPQFSCSLDAVKIKSHSLGTIQTAKSRKTINIRTWCFLSITSAPISMATATSLEFQKLHLSLEAAPVSVRADKSWAMSMSTAKSTMLNFERFSLLDTHPVHTAADKALAHAGAVDLPVKVDIGANSDKELLLTNDESVITAATSEVIALAKAAVKAAKDAAMMAGYHKSTKSVCTSIGVIDEVDTSIFEKSRPGLLSIRKSGIAEFGLGDYNNLSHHTTESDDVGPSVEDLEFLEAQLSKSIAVRSIRQAERKSRRTRAVAKTAATPANFMSVKSSSSSRKKHSPLQDVDFSDPLRYIRATANTSKLLTASEEQVLSKGIQVQLKLERLKEELKNRCGSQLTFAQWAAAANIDQKTLRKQLNYGVVCKNKMIKGNIRLVISIAKNYHGDGVNLLDLVQEGCRGLVRGAEKFDASKGFKFSTYAHWWIKQAVQKFLSEQSRTIRLPIHLVHATNKVKKARKQLYSENGRDPDDEEVAKATGLSMKRVTTVMLTPKPPRSLDQKISADMNLKPSEITANPEAETSEDVLMKQLMKQDLAEALDSLLPREKQVLRWRFGLEDGRMKTLQEIGEILGLTRERIRQIETSALRKMKSKKRIKNLQQYAMPLASHPHG